MEAQEIIDNYRAAFRLGLLLTVVAIDTRLSPPRHFDGELCSLGLNQWVFRYHDHDREIYMRWQRSEAISHLVEIASSALNIPMTSDVKDPVGWELWMKGRRI